MTYLSVCVSVYQMADLSVCVSVYQMANLSEHIDVWVGGMNKRLFECVSIDSDK